MKKINKILLTTLFFATLTACGESKPNSVAPTSDISASTDKVGDKIVEDIAIKTTPRTEYVVGDTFEITGGVIELQYEDGSKGELSFTDSRVHVSTPDMTTPGTKTVKVEYDGFEAQYQITVKKQAFVVTLDLNYEGAPAAMTLEVEVGGYANKPADPVRQDYRFLGWFTDKEGTQEFDFSSTTIDANLTLYASWVQELAVSFDLDDGSAATKVAAAVNQPISVFDAPSVLREGYQFDGWYNGNERYDFNATVTTSISLKAKWTAIPVGIAARKVTVDYNNGENTKIEYYVADGATTFTPSDPNFEGKEFLGWYQAKTGADKFVFTAAIKGDVCIVAHYKVDFYTVNFKYVVDGNEVIFKTKQVNPGEKVSTVIQKPRVENYRFDGKWYSDKACTKEFDFNQTIEADYDLYMKALKKNVFEAEYTYIDENKQGVGSSDSFTGLKLIYEDNGTAGASNGYWVSGLYNNGSFIEFIIESEKDFSDGTLEMSLSSEWADIYIAPTESADYHAWEIASYKAETNDNGELLYDSVGYAQYDESTKETVDYAPIALTGAISFAESAYDKRPFDTHIMTEAFSLHKGYNVVRLTTKNSVSPFDGTMNAHAPMIDYLAIYTDSELTWTPKTDNVSDWHDINFAPNKHGL